MGDEQNKKLLTVKDIALAISLDRTEEGLSKTIRQIRHWTQSDLLRPVSQISTGKGVPRSYLREPTYQIAAVLHELTRYGVTVDILRHASKELYQDYDDYEEMDGWYLQTTLTDMNVFLQIAWDTDSETGEFVGAKVKLFDDADLSEEPGQYGKGDDSEANERVIMRDPTSSILINVTNLVIRIPSELW